VSADMREMRSPVCVTSKKAVGFFMMEENSVVRKREARLSLATLRSVTRMKEAPALQHSVIHKFFPLHN
jgi:hypothetical protein